MNAFLRIDINLMAMILLSIVVFIAGRRLDKRDMINKPFLTVSKVILLQLSLETVTCIINNRPEPWLMLISVILHTCLFITAPVLSIFWFLFIYSLTIKDKPMRSAWNILLLIPVAANTVLALLSPQSGLVFSVSDANVYRRGPLFIFSSGIILFYLLLGFVLVVVSKRKIIRQDFIPLSLLAILPLAGGICQTIFYGPLLMWSGTAFSLVIVFIFLKDRMVQLDYLTGTWSRNTFDLYIKQAIKAGSNDERGIIYLDIDDLKHINDVYGHAEGDYTLQTAIWIVRTAIRKNDIVSRLGGDEFGVILNGDNCTHDQLSDTFTRIQTAFDAYNDTSGKPYKISCSIGADIYNPEKRSFIEFMDAIDSKMYESKKKKKPDGWRKN